MAAGTGRVARPVTSDSAPDAPAGAGPDGTNRTEEDRVVSRRVDNPTSASPDDERSYRAAEANPDPNPTDPTRPSGGTSDSARRDLDADAESEPDRSE